MILIVISFGIFSTSQYTDWGKMSELVSSALEN